LIQRGDKKTAGWRGAWPATSFCDKKKRLKRGGRDRAQRRGSSKRNSSTRSAITESRTEKGGTGIITTLGDLIKRPESHTDRKKEGEAIDKDK